MNTPTLERIVDELVKAKIFQVTITGGEPLLNKKILFEAIKKLIENKIPCAVNSNLTLLKKEDAEMMYGFGMLGVLTSFFSFDETIHDFIAGRKGAFRDTLNGISVAIESGLKVAVSMVITKFNEKDIIKTAKFLKDYGVNQFFATKASPPVNSTNFQKHMVSNDSLIKSLDDLFFLQKEERMDVGILECYPLCAYLGGSYEFAKKRSCSAGITTCTIGTNGDVRPCSHSDDIYGNIMANDLTVIWKNMVNLREESVLPTECISCSYLQECSGGCRVDAKYCHGKINSLDPYARPEKTPEIIINKTVFALPDDYNCFIFENNRIERIEDGGVLIASLRNPGEPVLITDDTYDLLLGFDGQFSIDMFSNESGLDKNLSEKICAMFLRDGIIKGVTR
jgi:radical SAM protein with 4Fe4S-binding SPASM domain